jgi:hypothetical protein
MREPILESFSHLALSPQLSPISGPDGSAKNHSKDCVFHKKKHKSNAKTPPKKKNKRGKKRRRMKSLDSFSPSLSPRKFVLLHCE